MALNARNALRLALDPSGILVAQGITPDAWQRAFLMDESPQSLLCCSRGAGKSRTTSAKALHRALFKPASLVLLLSRSQRQSGELFRYVKEGYRAIGRPIALAKETETQLEFANSSRIVCLPGKEETIRSYQGVSLLIIDEAARVPDDLYSSVRPMLGISQGQLVALTTPWGQRGWFWKEWSSDAEWNRQRIQWQQCPRLTPEWIEQERRSQGESWIRQEYECSFESLSGLVYPDFRDKCGCDMWIEPAHGQRIGGMDFGFRNPFAAIWGTLDREGVLWISGEYYKRQAGLHEHAATLPKDVEMWYADPSHPTEINALRRAGFTIRLGTSAVQAGIAAVKSRIETGRLKVNKQRCPNLIAEASMYHYDPDRPGENPVDADNHALAALRYIVSRIDAGFVAAYMHGQKNSNPYPAVITEPLPEPSESAGSRFRKIMESEHLWQ